MEPVVNIVGIVGSPRRGGNTEVMVGQALEAASESNGTLTSMIPLYNKKIAPCNGCGYCWNKRHGECNIKDDADEVIEEMTRADGLIIGTPVYFGASCATVKALMERCLRLNVLKEEERQKVPSLAYEFTKDLDLHYPLRNKVGGAIAVGGFHNGGQEHAINEIHAFFFINDMFVVVDGGIRTAAIHPHFGGVGLGRRRGDVINDDYSIKTARSLGMRVAEAAQIIRRGLLGP